ncbi:MAG: MATE family efflux transporter [Sulfuritalea sp.]|nr:MATE family efflux transporter [Sulfuritalea sp.]
MTAMAAAASRTRDLLQAPLLPTLFRLATPNVIGLFATTIVIGYDGYILGRLGADALAGVALVFPLSMLMLQISAGGIGGAVTAGVARALGGGRAEDADRIAQHALLIATVLAAIFMLVMLGFGGGIYRAMGGRDAALDAALSYSTVLFGGSLLICLANILAAIVRGAGNMVLPSAMLAGTAILHLFLCPLLVFGWGPVAGLGLAGAALSTLGTNLVAAAVLLAYLSNGRAAVQLLRVRWELRREFLRAILRVGAPASLSPILSNGSIAAATALIGSYGTAALAGYGVAARLEYIMIPIAFGFGTALTTLVATNMGAGQHERALRATWTGGAVVAILTGIIGIVAAIAPGLWMDLFSSDPEVLAIGSSYLRVVGGCYSLFGLGLALFFASQGAGRMFWPLAGSVARLVVVTLGGWLAVHVWQVPASGFFVVIAAGFVIYAVMIAGAIRLGTWVRA